MTKKQTMNLEQLKTYCLIKKGTSCGFPFDDETLVFKVGPKMFALTNIKSNPLRVNLKCDPVMAFDLRAEFPTTVQPGYHMNKLHWNTVIIDGTVPEDRLKQMIDHSYNLVFKGLKKAEKETILQF